MSNQKNKLTDEEELNRIISFIKERLIILNDFLNDTSKPHTFTDWQVDFLTSISSEYPEIFDNIDDNKVQQKTIDPSVKTEIYVDGSFNKENQKYGSGVVVTQNGQVIDELSFYGDNPTFLLSYQIGGEVEASIAAMKWAVDNNIKDITLIYDYRGIECWATGEWKANKPIAKHYVTATSALLNHLNVEFVKVKSHTGVEFNERADVLAGQACS